MNTESLNTTPLNITISLTDDPSNGIEFRTKYILSLPEPIAIHQYPYSYSSMPQYNNVDYDLASETRYSTMSLFGITFSLTYQQRQEIFNYFIRNRYKEFDIKIQDDLWRGYLTLNNNELFNENFKNEASIVTIQFEAMFVGKE